MPYLGEEAAPDTLHNRASPLRRMACVELWLLQLHLFALFGSLPSLQTLSLCLAIADSALPGLEVLPDHTDQASVPTSARNHLQLVHRLFAQKSIPQKTGLRATQQILQP